MSVEEIKKQMRDFVQALAAGDANQASSFVTDDVIWSSPDGTFKGKEGLKKYVGWMKETNPESGVTESGLGIMVQGDKAFFEHVLNGTHDGEKWETLAMCAYEFSEGKIRAIRTVYDRLFIAKQVAKGLLARKAVDGIINRFEKGLS
jgi:ketosteroid isomerase-like protein